jgi:acetyl-CoA carboxylase beta subunit
MKKTMKKNPITEKLTRQRRFIETNPRYLNKMSNVDDDSSVEDYEDDSSVDDESFPKIKSKREKAAYSRKLRREKEIVVVKAKPIVPQQLVLVIADDNFQIVDRETLKPIMFSIVEVCK